MCSSDLENSDELLGRSLDLVEEKREKAMIHMAYYHQKLKRGYDANVKLRPLSPGDLVMRKILGSTKNPSWGKLGGTVSHHLCGRNRCLLPRRLR